MLRGDSSYCNPRSRHPKRRRPRSPGVMLRGRAAGLGYWDDENRYKGAKRMMRGLVRARERERFLRGLRDL